jgi:hypothetical protein
MMVEMASSRCRKLWMPRVAPAGVDLGARLVGADHAQQAAVRAQRGRVARHVGGAAEALFALFDAHDRHRRFRRNAADVAEPVAVEHDVADDEDAHVVARGGEGRGGGCGWMAVVNRRVGSHGVAHAGLSSFTLSSSVRRGG